MTFLSRVYDARAQLALGYSPDEVRAQHGGCVLAEALRTPVRMDDGTVAMVGGLTREGLPRIAVEQSGHEQAERAVHEVVLAIEVLKNEGERRGRPVGGRRISLGAKSAAMLERRARAKGQVR